MRSVSDLALRMGIKLVAEGIESASQAELLIQAGCREAQGFLFARPTPADQAVDLLVATFDGWSHPVEPRLA